MNTFETNCPTEYMDIFNWYRNLYYQEEPNTEQGIMARAINELFMNLKDKNMLCYLTDK